MIVPATREDHAALVRGSAPRNFRNADTPISAPEVLHMLADLAEQIRQVFDPASWLVVHDEEVVGLFSITRLPIEGAIDIGYGIAPSRGGLGHARRALGEVVAWAERDPRVTAITADTGVQNLPSQRVLMRNGFARSGERIDEEDGPLFCWRRPVG